MGFSFRKSFKIAPDVRLNVSKSGLGLSAGVKGARVSVGPHGTRVYGGEGPLRYQSGLGSGSRSRRATRTTSTPTDSGISFSDPFNLKRPTNWHAWIAFFSMGLPTMLVAPLHSEGLSSFAAFLGFGLWIYTLFKGPKSLRAYRSFKDTALSELPAEEKVQFLQKIYEDYPANAIKVELAQALCNEKRPEEAILHLKALAAMFPIALFHAELGQAYLNCKQYDEAINSFTNCDEEDEFDNFMVILRLKAMCYVGKREFDKAIECVDEDLRRRGEKHVENKRALRLLKAAILIETNDAKEAQKELEKLISEVPNHAEVAALLNKIKLSA